MLSVPPSTRVALGTVEVAGKKLELFLSPEWGRYFESLNSQVRATSAALAESGALTALLSDAMETPDVFPGPPGQQGTQGDAGLALFMLQDDPGEQAMLVPPCVDGVYVPLNSKDAPGGVPGLTQFKLNLKNAAGTVTSGLSTGATAPRTWTMPDKNGTVAVLGDFSAPPAIGGNGPAAGNFTALTASAGFGCNGKNAQSPAASGGTLAGVIAALVANGILSS